MLEYQESLDRLTRKNQKLDETAARIRERERRRLQKLEKQQQNTDTNK